MLSIIVPCHNEIQALPFLYDALHEASQLWSEPTEFILVDDGSTDGTWEEITRYASQDFRVRGVSLSRNFGHQAAIGAGFESARGNAIAVIDADLQDPPEVIAEMIVHWKSGYDVVYGTRSKRQGETMFKRFTAKTFYSLFARLTRLPIPMQTGDFALMDAKVVRSLLQFREHGLYWRGLRCWNGFRQRHVSFSRPERIAGKSSYSFFKSLSLAKDAIFSFSEIPKRIPLYFFLLFLAGGIFALGLSFHLYGSRIALWPSLPLPFLILIIAMGLAQFLCVWLGSEYSARILDNVRDRPRWIIDKRTAHLEGKETNHA